MDSSTCSELVELWFILIVLFEVCRHDDRGDRRRRSFWFALCVCPRRIWTRASRAVLLGGLLVVLQLMLGEIVAQTPGHHRLVNYIGIYTGRFWKWVTLVALSLGVWGAMLAYMLVGGTFLHLLLSPILGGGEAVYSYALAIIASALVFGGLVLASRIEYLVVGALLFLFTFIILASLPLVDVSHYTTLDLKEFFIPYGVILFSLSGMGIVPELKDVLGKRIVAFFHP